MKEYHILNGDSLKNQLEKLSGNKIVLRECLIEGNVEGNTIEEVFTNRTKFFMDSYGIRGEEYESKSINEISKILNIESNSIINLWFENDLFCQVNLWFTINFLSDENPIYLVSPQGSSWKGFGNMTYSNLLKSYNNRKEISRKERKLIKALWLAYQNSDWKALKKNSKALRNLIDKIEEVVVAHIERFPEKGKAGRPQKSISQIIKKLKKPEFKTIFKAFSELEGIYGFGDIQVKRIIEEMKKET